MKRREGVAAVAWCLRLAVLAAAGAVLCLGAARADEPSHSPYGGERESGSPGTGWFRTARQEGRWWLVDPVGYRFLSIGVNRVSYVSDRIQGTGRSPYREAVARKYGSPRRWAQAVVRRLRGWGFNTLGARSDPATWREGMAYTVLLDLAGQVRGRPQRAFPDVFSPGFERVVRRAAARICRPLAHDPWLIGYFTDDELPWGGPGHDEEPLFTVFMRLPDQAPGRQALLRFLADRYLTIDELNEDWGTGYSSFQEIGRVPQAGAHIPPADEADFLRLVAERYFSITSEAVRAADPNHLVLGCRFAGSPPRPVLEGMKRFVDVVSVNYYGLHPPKDALREIYRITERPVLVTEFSFRARDSGLPNTLGGGPLLDTQEERGEAYVRFVRELIGLPMVIGYHWFQHADQPAEGGSNGGNSNCGLVNIEDEPYLPLVEAAEQANREAYQEAERRAPLRAHR